MNYFGVAVAILQAAACIEAVFNCNWKSAIIYASFSIGSVAIAWR